jgi:hypothetical protein
MGCPNCENGDIPSTSGKPIKCFSKYVLLISFFKNSKMIYSQDLAFEKMRSDIQTYAEKYVFLDYSASHWTFHAQQSHNDKHNWTSKTAKLCDIGDGSGCAWFSVYVTSNDLLHMIYPKSKQSPVYWAALFGLYHEMRLFLDSSIDPNVQGGFFRNALQAASCEGHEQVVRLLLNRGAQVNAYGGFYVSALCAAAHGGHEQVVKLLLDKGTDVYMQLKSHRHQLQAALAEGRKQKVESLPKNWRLALFTEEKLR